MSEHLPESVADLQPSARWTYRELQQADGPLTVTELVHRTGYSKRGIRHATEALQSEGLIVEQWSDGGDCKCKLFAVRP